jgi:serine/threonine protein kinase/TPR repeat protein
MKTLGNFEILEKIGQGAMGVVYKARDPLIGRFVALKTITTDLAGDPALLQRFYQEARSAGTLAHPNIVVIYELGKEGDTPFIAMQFLEGESLEKLLERRATFPLSQKIGFIVYVCRALEYAHTRGVVHRDIKPGNVMVTADGTVKVVDFGIARLVDTGRTRVGMMLGTLGYMSPQQFQDVPADARSDIWAAGIMFHEILAGRRPFLGNTASTLMANIIMQELPSIASAAPGTPPEVAAIIERMLKKDVNQRYQSMGEVLMELEPIWKRIEHEEVSGLLQNAEASLKARSEHARHNQNRRLEQWVEKLNIEINAGRLAEAIQAAETALGEFPGDMDLIILRNRAKTRKEAKEKQDLLERRIKEVNGKIESGRLTDAIALARQTLVTLGPNTELSLRLHYAEVEFAQREKKKREQEETLKAARTLAGAGMLGDAGMIREPRGETRIYSGFDPLLREMDTRKSSPAFPAAWPIPTGNHAKNDVYQEKEVGRPETSIPPIVSVGTTPSRPGPRIPMILIATAVVGAVMVVGVIYRSLGVPPNPPNGAAGGVSKPEQLKNLKPQGYVNDFALVLSTQAKEKLTAMCVEVDQKAKAQIAVVTVSSLEGEPVEQFSNDLAARWGVGRKQSRGVLILLAPNEGKYRIEVGDGLEPILSDDKVGRFSREGAPFLQRSDYDDATLLLTQRVADVIADDQTAERIPQTPGSFRAEGDAGHGATSNDKGAQGSQTSQKAPRITPAISVNAPAKSAGQQPSKVSTLLDANGKFSESVNSYQSSCSRGEAADCRRLGLMYANGQGAAKDESRAAQLYQKSCDGSDTLGCRFLGDMYLNGQGVTKDGSRAVQLYQKSCDEGGALDCSFLGDMYLNGREVTKDESRAAQLYQKSCDEGDARDCSNLGLMYENGRGVAKDVSRAVQLLQKGCDLGEARACAVVKK